MARRVLRAHLALPPSCLRFRCESPADTPIGQKDRHSGSQRHVAGCAGASVTIPADGDAGSTVGQFVAARAPPRGILRSTTRRERARANWR